MQLKIKFLCRHVLLCVWVGIRNNVPIYEIPNSEQSFQRSNNVIQKCCYPVANIVLTIVRIGITVSSKTFCVFVSTNVPIGSMKLHIDISVLLFSKSKEPYLVS